MMIFRVANACGGGSSDSYLTLIDNILQENTEHNTDDLRKVEHNTDDLRKNLFLHHEYESHCAVLTVPRGYNSKFWKSESGKYDHFKKGRCPSKYNYINKRVSDIEGFQGVYMTERDTHSPVRSFRDIVAAGYSCPADPCGCCPTTGAKCPCLCGGGWCKRCCK